MTTRKNSGSKKEPAVSLYPSAMMPRISARVSKKSEIRIKQFALKEDTTVQTLIVRGLSRLLEDDGLKPLDELE